MTTYYVDSVAGNDTNAGTSTGAPWKTIAKVNARTLVAGDYVLFKCGGLWRERLLPHNSGTSSSQITFGSYGTGAQPKIYGSDVLSGWSIYSGNIWRAAHTGSVSPVWFISSGGVVTWGNQKTSVGACTVEYDWYYDTNYVYVYAATDPDSRYASVEAGYRSAGVGLNSKSYITIDDIEVAFCGQYCIELTNEGYVGWIVQNCTLHHVGILNSPHAHGIGSRVSNAVFQNNLIYNCGTHGIYIVGGTSPTHDVDIVGNDVSDCPHTGIDIMSYTAGTTVTDVRIRGNIVHTTSDYPGPSGMYMIGIQTLSQGGGVCSNITIEYNIVHNAYGISILVCDDSDTVKVINNSVYKSAGNFQGIAVLGGAINTYVLNNIVLEVGGSNYYYEAASAIAESDYNLSYHPTETTGQLFRVASTTYYLSGFSAFKSATGFETHGIWADPEFVDAAGLDFHLRTGSPAIDAGTVVTGIHDVSGSIDFFGTRSPQRSKPSIGAYEYVRRIIRGRVLPGL